jgi:hypothetical protein
VTMPHAFSANVFSVLAAGTTVFQLALVVGAPWGALTQGGRIIGALPPSARAIAALSALLLLAFVSIVRAHARTDFAPRYPRAIWIVVAYCALGVLANAVTPSPSERALWLPVVILMFASSLHVAKHPRPPVPTGT